MRNQTILLILTLAVSSFIGCMSAGDEKTGDLNNNPQKTNEELKREQDNEIYLKDKEQFKSEYSYKIGYNEGRIAEIKSNMKKTDRDYTAKNQRIEELEQRNRELKNRLDKPDSQTAERWKQFKSEFKQDAEALGDALKGFFKENETHN